MATIALSRPLPPQQHPRSMSSTATITLENINTNPQQSQHPAALPNKHIPVCPPGPVPQEEPATPPSSPSSSNSQNCAPQSLLYPPSPSQFPRLQSGNLFLYKITANQVAAALDHIARQPLPEPSQVFPWLHGLHPSNQVQQAFFAARKRTQRKTPTCLRGVMVVKADGDLTVSRLKGAVAPHELLDYEGGSPEFLDVDPREGFSVRNFQIQTAKAAMTSDIIVYGDDEGLVRKLGWDVAAAQQKWRERHENAEKQARHSNHHQHHHSLPVYNTFVWVGNFSKEFEETFPDIVSVNSEGQLTGRVLDFFHQERREMYMMTIASEISTNVWLGPTPDQGGEEEQAFDVLIETTDLGRLDVERLRAVVEGDEGIAENGENQQVFLEFPASGSILAPTWSHAEADGILETCKWIWHIAHGTHPAIISESAGEDGNETIVEADDGSTRRVTLRPRKVLLHCADGYTESTMLGIAYYSYATGRPIPDAWLHLHTHMERNFFAYPSDVALLTAIAHRLLQESPVMQGRSLSEITAMVNNEPKWFTGFDGSFPSRVLPYMYLGNLGHANNPDLLRSLGIGQLLSVGETAMWRDGELEEWGVENTFIVQNVQDNGIDPLTEEFARCLEFIDRGRRNGTATLVHCRVGVSRSATICIAEVMQRLDISFPRAYCFVRARRLNVIIQPHLRFAYELLKWEELLGISPDAEADADITADYIDDGDDEPGFKRELEWPEITREIALMNRPYTR
ncbi:putative dual specificity protein phosphatase [Podospora fimiseda]|uniref:Dual specificity protein phosphatase n=1 Tax=Podospora fimiseda TaxID=252190 RepID=A0AAN7GY74_9PEZI|nr:putative dual specificity protein phosphatase [Podospora fimiseda]